MTRLASAERTDEHGRLLVCFDFEGSYGMPHDVPYNLEKSASLILAELARHQAHAVFFVVGRIVEEYPDVVRAIAAEGHEIGLHGYEHDDLSRYDLDALAMLDKNLAQVGSLLENMTGTRPRCFRAPYLLAPHFYRSEVYAMLQAQGFRWVSNREIRYPVELLRPGLLPLRNAWRGPQGAPRLASNRLLLGALNTGLLARETFHGSIAGRLQWLLRNRPPFTRDGMVEVPIYAPLDCDLLGLPEPDTHTPGDTLAYSSAVLRAAIASGGLATITFHDWIVSGGNRLGLLRDALAVARDTGVLISTVADNPDWLPSPA